MVVDNSKIEQTSKKKKTNRLSLRKPCWAIVQHFDKLSYFLDDNRIIFEAQQDQIYLGYYSIQDKYTIKTHAGHIEAEFIETQQGHTEIKNLLATDGVIYEEESDDKRKRKRSKQFKGSGLFYDADSQLVNIWGDDYWPCFLNGAAVDGIEYNMKTGKRKAKMVSPSTLF